MNCHSSPLSVLSQHLCVEYMSFHLLLPLIVSIPFYPAELGIHHSKITQTSCLSMPWRQFVLAQHRLLWWVFQRPVGMSQMSAMLESLSGLLADPPSCGSAHCTNTYHSPPVSCGVVTLGLLSSLDFMPAHCSRVITFANLCWPGVCWLSDSLFCHRVIWLHATFCFQDIRLRYVNTSEPHCNIFPG